MPRIGITLLSNTTEFRWTKYVEDEGITSLEPGRKSKSVAEIKVTSAKKGTKLPSIWYSVPKLRAEPVSHKRIKRARFQHFSSQNLQLRNVRNFNKKTIITSLAAPCYCFFFSCELNTRIPAGNICYSVFLYYSQHLTFFRLIKLYS